MNLPVMEVMRVTSVWVQSSAGLKWAHAVKLPAVKLLYHDKQQQRKTAGHIDNVSFGVYTVPSLHCGLQVIFSDFWGPSKT